MVCFIDRYEPFIDNAAIWFEPLDANIDYSLPHERVNIIGTVSFHVSSSPNIYPSLSDIFEQEEDIINTFINMTLPSFDAPSRDDSLMDIHNPYFKASLEIEDNGNILNTLSYSDKSMDDKYLNQFNVSQLILTLKGYPLSNKPLITLKGCLLINLKGGHRDPKDYHMVSHTYHTRNNPQPTTSLPPSQHVLPPPPNCLSQNLGLDYDLVS